MSLRPAPIQLYRASSSASAETDSRAGASRQPGGSASADGDYALMEYRDFVTAQALGRPSQIFQNRNEGHATVVIEHVFVGADKWAHVVARNVNPTVYGTPGVIAGARQMLSRAPEARIIILAEEPVDRALHPFFTALDSDVNMRSRVELHFVPGEVQRRYKFNFGVNDQDDYRFESSREGHEAMVQFGGKDFARDLESTFQGLLIAAKSSSKSK
jgi:hypothetical protein